MINMPASIDGYSQQLHYAALVLPILENAIESSKPNTSVSVVLTEQDELVNLMITNEPYDEPGGDEIYEPGHTSKKGHDGMGLSSVRYLLSAHRGATVNHKYAAPCATFSISLPRGTS